MSVICTLFGHKWNGCKCERCTKIRDEQHNWSQCKCTMCGKTQSIDSISDIDLILTIAYDAVCDGCHGSRRTYPFGLADAAARKLVVYASEHDDCALKILFYIACHGADKEASYSALRRISDEETLGRIAFQCNDPRIALSAVKKMKSLDLDSEQAKRYSMRIEQELVRYLHAPFFKETKKDFDNFFHREST